MKNLVWRVVEEIIDRGWRCGDCSVHLKRRGNRWKKETFCVRIFFFRKEIRGKENCGPFKRWIR
jgi:hypothetical protein